jgi:2'-5' RNA ligase
MVAKKGGTIRAFVALDLDTLSLRRVARVAERLRMGSGAPSATWVPPEKMHVTLKFAGELKESAVIPLAEALAPLAEGMGAPQACPLRLDAFPSIEDASVVIVQLEDASGGLAKLARKIEKLLSFHGVRKDSHAFRPHVTLARLKRSYDAKRWLRPELAAGVGDCRMATLTLYRSDLGESGSTYVPLARFSFQST